MDDMRQIPCPMCGRPVAVREDGPVPCPSCGVPVSAPAAAEPPASSILAEDDSATRIATIPPSEPAPAEATPAVIAATMPAVEQPAQPSAPVSPVSDTTDPRTQPVSAAEVQQAAYPPAMPAPAVEQSAPAPVPTPEQPVTQTYHGAPPQQPVTQPYTPAMTPTPQQGQSTPKRNPALLIIGVVVAVVLLLGIAGAAVVFANRISLGAVPTPTAVMTPHATATATIPAGFVQFTDQGNVYKINYPSEWKKTAESGDFSLTIFSGTPQNIPGVFEVEYFKTKVDPKTVQDTFFTTLEKTGKVTNKQEPTTVSLAGESWQREAADVGTGSVTQHVVVLAANHGQYSVLIAYLAPTIAFDNADTQAFQPMLSSFQFLQ